MWQRRPTEFVAARRWSICGYAVGTIAGGASTFALSLPIPPIAMIIVSPEMSTVRAN